MYMYVINAVLSRLVFWRSDTISEGSLHYLQQGIEERKGLFMLRELFRNYIRRKKLLSKMKKRSREQQVV